LVNQGTITADVSGQPLTIELAGTFTNKGTAKAINGGMLSIGATDGWSSSGSISTEASTLTFLNAWSNTGTINSANNSIVNLGGTFTLAGLGTFNGMAGTVMNITGTLENTASTLTLNATTGSWNLVGGTIMGGTLTFDPGQTLVLTASGGLLSGVTVNGDLTLGGGLVCLCGSVTG
jgi:hypothetical protein